MTVLWSSPDGTVAALLEQINEECAALPVLLGPDIRATGRDVWQDVRRKAQVLMEAGATRTTRIGVLSSNGVEAALAFFAAAQAGVCVPVNPALTEHEVAQYLSAMRVDLVVLAGDAVDLPLAPGTTVLRWSAPLAELPDAGSSGSPTTPNGGCEPPRPDDICLLLATSGTTSRPKIVPLTHSNVVSSARTIARSLELTTVDLGLNVMPLFHVHGLLAGLLAPLSVGGSVYCLPTKEPAAMVEVLATEPVTWYTAVPTIHRAVVETAAGTPAPKGRHLRFVRSCSSALSPSLMEKVEHTLGVPVVEAYGMTEASHQLATNPLPPRTRRPGSVGLPSGAEIRIVDPGGLSVPANRTGAILVRGPGVTQGYLYNPAANEAAFVGGWFVTGDEGYLDEDGYLHLSGRTKELINRGGEKIFPREIDEALLRHPDVEQALAFPVQHPRLGEDVAAAVVPRADASLDVDELRRFAGRFLAEFKVPRLIVVVPELPTGPTGKPQRIGLADRLGLSDRTRARTAGATGPIRLGDPEPRQRAVAEIWAGILEVADLGPDEDFFAAGGDSILAVRLLRQVNQRFSVQLPVSCVFGAGSSVRGMARLLTEESRERLPALVPTGDPAPVELAPQQTALWLAQAADPTSTVLNTALVIELRGDLRYDLLRAALDRVVRRHDALRVGFPDQDGVPRMVLSDAAGVELEILDRPAVPASDGRDIPDPDLYAAIVEPLLDRPFDIAKESLARAHLCRIDHGAGPTTHLLTIVIHHLVCDAWSRAVICRDLLATYEELTGGAAADLPALPVQIQDVAAWQRRCLDATRNGALGYWRNAFAGLDVYRPLGVHRPPAGGSRRAGRIGVPMGADLRERIGEVARAMQVSNFEVVLGCLPVAMSAWFGVAQTVVGVPVSLRHHPDLSDQVGYYVSMVPLRLRALPGEPIASTVARVAESHRAAVEHADVPLDEIVAEVDRRARADRGPLFEVVVKRDVHTVVLPRPTTVQARIVSVGQASPQYPLIIDLTDALPTGAGHAPSEIRFDYDPARCAERDIRAMATDLLTVLGELTGRA